MHYERNTHFVTFRRGGQPIMNGSRSHYADIGRKTLKELEEYANQQGGPHGLVARLSNEKPDFCIYVYDSKG